MTADLGSEQQIAALRALSLSWTESGIYHPQGLAIETSTDGVQWVKRGNATTATPDTATFSVGWSELDIQTVARYVRFDFTHQEWLFISELEVLGDPNGTEISLNPPSGFLYAGQSLQFTPYVAPAGTGVNWLAIGAGTVTQTGLYTAPATVSATSTAEVLASAGSGFATAAVTVAPNPTGVQMAGPVSPASGSGRSQTFSFTARPVSGSLDWVEIVLGANLSPYNSCYLFYDGGSGLVFLFSDDGLTTTSALPGTPGAVLSNSHCTVNVGNGAVQQLAGGAVTITLPMVFGTLWSGNTLDVWMAARDTDGNELDWPLLGTWVVP